MLAADRMFRFPLIEAPAGDGKQPVASSSGWLTLFDGVVSEPNSDNNHCLLEAVFPVAAA